MTHLLVGRGRLVLAGTALAVFVTVATLAAFPVLVARFVLAVLPVIVVAITIGN
jgi:hypothetical protein